MPDERLIGFSSAAETEQIRHVPRIEYTLKDKAPITWDYDVNVSIVDGADTAPVKNTIPDRLPETHTITNNIVSGLVTQINTLVSFLPPIAPNVSAAASSFYSVPSYISIGDYVNSSLDGSDPMLVEIAEEALAGVHSNSRAETIVNLVDDFKDMVIIKEFLDNFVSFFFNGETSVSDSIAGTLTQITDGQKRMQQISTDLLAYVGNEDKEAELQEEFHQIQILNETNRNKLNIILNIASLVETKNLDSQFLLSEISMLNTSGLNEYFTEDLSDEIFGMLSVGNIKENINRVLASLRMSYERNKDSILNDRKAYSTATPKTNLKQILDNIAINSKISIEMSSQLLYNNIEVNTHTSYLSDVLSREVEDVNKDLLNALDQLYYYIKGLHYYRSNEMASINAKNKKRIIYKVIEDLSKKTNSIANGSDLKREIESSINKVNEESQNV